MIKLNIPNINAIITDHHHRVCISNGLNGQANNLIDLVRAKSLTRGRNTPKKNFYKQLLIDLQLPFGQCIITCSPETHKKFITDYNANFPTVINDPDVLDELSSLFFYGTYKKWGASILANALGVNVCPYCNRQYTFTLDKTFTGKGTRPHFDHFYDQARYPFLSLSFYNLIPSCYICNSTLKGSEKFDIDTHLHPYKEGFDEKVKFTIKPSTVSFVNGLPSSFKIRYKVDRTKISTNSDIKRILRSSNSFRIIPLYNKHIDYVAEIIQKSIAYNEDYYTTLFNDFQGNLFNTIDDVKKMVLSNYISEEELGKRVLAKLTKDIAEELGII